MVTTVTIPIRHKQTLISISQAKLNQMVAIGAFSINMQLVKIIAMVLEKAAHNHHLGSFRTGTKTTHTNTSINNSTHHTIMEKKHKDIESPKPTLA